MASGRAIKNRIKSTKSIQQITKAMEAVSAVKMRKSEQAALKGRPFALYALDILRKIEKNISGESVRNVSALLRQDKVNKLALVVISSDKGLAGAFNSNVLRKADELIKNSSYEIDIVAVGKRAKEYFERKGKKIIKSYEGIGDIVSQNEAKHISEDIISLFCDKDYDAVDVVYTNFVSALKQEVIHRPLLPLTSKNIEEVIKNIIPETGKFSDIKENLNEVNAEYKFEPNPEIAVKELIPLLVEIEVFHSILEANASEHAARMVAMRNASDNAKEVIVDLTIYYNKTRQAQITKELIEITSGKEALEAQG